MKNLIDALLSVGLVVHWRYISSSTFSNDAYTTTDGIHGGDSIDAIPCSQSPQRQFNVAGCEACSRLQAQAGADNSSCQSCEGIVYNQIPLLEAFRFVAADDYLTSDLAEAPCYKWLFMIIHWSLPTA